jgi:hypothetical protein
MLNRSSVYRPTLYAEVLTFNFYTSLPAHTAMPFSHNDRFSAVMYKLLAAGVKVGCAGGELEDWPTAATVSFTKGGVWRQLSISIAVS